MKKQYVGLIVIFAITMLFAGCIDFFCKQPGIPAGTREEDILEQAMLSEKQAKKEASSKAVIAEQAKNEENILKAIKICKSVGLTVTNVEYDSSLKKNRNQGSYGTGVIIHTENFVFHLCQINVLGLCHELTLVPVKLKHPGKDEWTDAFGRDFVPFCSCSRGFEEYYLVLGAVKSKDTNSKNIGNIGLKFPPKEIYTGTIVDVELIPWSCPGPTPLDKFEYKIGSKHIVEVITDYTGRRAVKEVTVGSYQNKE